MISVKHRTAGDALIAALHITQYYVVVIDPTQSGNAIVERKWFYTKKKAENYIIRQKKIDSFNIYKLVTE